MQVIQQSLLITYCNENHFCAAPQGRPYHSIVKNHLKIRVSGSRSGAEPKSHQFVLVTHPTCPPSFVRISSCLFEISCSQTSKQTDRGGNVTTHCRNVYLIFISIFTFTLWRCCCTFSLCKFANSSDADLPPIGLYEVLAPLFLYSQNLPSWKTIASLTLPSQTVSHIWIITLGKVELFTPHGIVYKLD